MTDTGVEPDRVSGLLGEETERFRATHPESAKLFERARSSLLGGVPMPWMTQWAGSYPVFVAEASGARFSDVDGNEYADFCLGDTGAMAGHAPLATADALARQSLEGTTLMLPTEDSVWVGEELERRFGLPFWQFALTATDANRFVLRLARAITDRPKVVVHSWCYHGTVDETFAIYEDGATRPRPGSIGAPVDPAVTTRAVEFNDVDALEEALAPGDVACVLCEPALTNMGIVLPDAGYHDALRELTQRHGTLLVIDETHTICTGPGGYTRAHDLHPDFLTIGKPIAGGVPAAAYGMSREVADRALADRRIAEESDIGGIGGTLSGNALSLAAVRATLESVLTDEAFDAMIALGKRFEEGAAGAIAAARLPWSVTRLGCRVEYHFTQQPPSSGAEAHAAVDHELERYLHLHALNRGILMTPFHNMALMCPATSEEAVDLHTRAFTEALESLSAA